MIELIAAGSVPEDQLKVVQIANDVDPESVVLEGVDRVELSFPKFSDGRAENFLATLRRVGHDPFKAAANAARLNEKEAA